MMLLSRPTLLLLLTAALATAACATNASDDPATDGAEESDEQDLTEAPYLEVVKTDDAQGTKIVAHGLPAVSRTTNPAGSLEQAALLLERPSTVPGYVGYSFDERSGMGSFTGMTLPLLNIDEKTSPPTVTVHQNFVNLANEQMKKEHWSRFNEHEATDNTASTGFGWTVTYEPKAAHYPRLHIARNGAELVNKGASYWADQAFGPTGCKYVPELASAAVSTQHKAVLLRVHYNTSDAACSIADKYFTEALP